MKRQLSLAALAAATVLLFPSTVLADSTPLQGDAAHEPQSHAPAPAAEESETPPAGNDSEGPLEAPLPPEAPGQEDPGPGTPESEGPPPAPPAPPATSSPAPSVGQSSGGGNRLEENSPALTFSGTWTAGSSGAASGGGYRYAHRSGSAVAFRFKGTAVAWIGPVGPTYGRAEVWLDGKLVAVVSQYAATFQHQSVVWSVSDLADGEHELIIRVLGTKEPASSGTVIVVDAFDIAGAAVLPPSWLPGGKASYEESDSRAFKEGRWVGASTQAASGGSLVYTGTIGSTFTIHFSGTRVAWIGPRFNNYGRAAIYLDGVYQATVSQYAASAAHRQVIWSIEGLRPGRHTLTIRVLGQKDAASRGTVIAVDGFTVDELLVPRIEETSSHVRRVGTWVKGNSTSASGGAYSYSRHADAHAVVQFWGTSFRWIGVRGPEYGMVEVYLDGRSVGVVDLYSPKPVFGETIWSVSGLKDGYHAVVIRVLGRSSPRSSGSIVILDAFEFEGAGAARERWADPPPTARIEESEGRAVRAGTWRGGTSAAASSGGYVYSSAPGSSFTVHFTGTSVAWIGPVGPTYGQARIFLDGVLVGTVSQYAQDFAHQQVVWSVSGLADTAHSLTIHVLGTRDAASSGNVIVIDGVDVTGAQKQRFEEGDRASARAGVWQVGNTASASASGYVYSHRPGSRITVRFIGTSVAWIGPVGPTYGHARIYLDGVRIGTVSQYAPHFAHQQVVWSASGLSDGVHTLTVHVLGTKDSASKGTLVVVDGFDVTGERVTTRGLIVSTAKQQLGKQYVWAATGPNTFDCSGLVLYCYRAAGVSAPRTSRQQWQAVTAHATVDSLLPGDLVFLSRPSYIHHVGIYVGFGLTIHAPATGKFVEYRAAHTWACFGRMPATSWPGRYNGA